ncbi:MAG: helix-turn-helix transcriptional regulator [Pyrinomonadaceae bacterium]|nr:helix-turn-helix transcriptional regulator [Pyrinomonadaceae bacterium]
MNATIHGKFWKESVRAGQKLKAIRKDRHMTVRQVEQASRRIAEAEGDRKFFISNGWLTQIENGASEPSICKLFSLSAIYNVGINELMRIYNVDADESDKYNAIAIPGNRLPS